MGWSQNVHPSSGSPLWLFSIGALVDPGLGNVDVCWIRSSLSDPHRSLVGSGGELVWILNDRANRERLLDASFILEAHAFDDDSFVACLDQVFVDFMGDLLSAEAHLQDGLLDGFACDLSCQGPQLLLGSLEEIRLRHVFPLCPGDHHFLGQTTAFPDMSNDLGPLPASSGIWAGVEHSSQVGQSAVGQVIFVESHFLFVFTFWRVLFDSPERRVVGETTHLDVFLERQFLLFEVFPSSFGSQLRFLGWAKDLDALTPGREES
jgi:hypothetical protein